MEAHELYEEKEELQLRLWEDEIARLRAAAQTAPEDVRIGYTYLITVLRRKLALAVLDLQGLEETGGSTWTAQRARFEADAYNFQHTLDDAIALLPA